MALRVIRSGRTSRDIYYISDRTDEELDSRNIYYISDRTDEELDVADVQKVGLLGVLESEVAQRWHNINLSCARHLYLKH
jgi:predicted secreted acid phosphatase